MSPTLEEAILSFQNMGLEGLIPQLVREAESKSLDQGDVVKFENVEFDVEVDKRIFD